MSYYPPKARTFHLRDDASNITGYKRLAMLPQTAGTEATLTGASNGDAETLIGSWSSDALGCTSLPAGVWKFYLSLAVDSATDVTKVKVYVYSRSFEGSETPLFNTLAAEINNTTVAQQITSTASQAAFVVADTDRLVVKIYATSNSSTDKTATLYYQGATNYSYIQVPNDVPVPLGDMSKEIYDPDGDSTVSEANNADTLDHHHWSEVPSSFPSTVTGYSTNNVSNPPTAADANAAFGAPGTVGAGYEGIINDNGAGLNVYRFTSDGANWWYSPLTKATPAPSGYGDLTFLVLDTFTDTNGESL